MLRQSAKLAKIDARVGDIAQMFEKAIIYQTLTYKKKELSFWHRGERRKANGAKKILELFTLYAYKKASVPVRESDEVVPEGKLELLEE